MGARKGPSVSPDSIFRSYDQQAKIGRENE